MFIHHEKSTAGNSQKWQNGLVKIREFRGPSALQVLGGESCYEFVLSMKDN